MLSSSADQTGISWNPRSITDPTVDPGLQGGRELVAFVDATHAGDPATLATARRDLRDALGDAATAIAAGVIGNFNQMNRLADATGMPVGEGRLRTTEALRAACGIAPFHAHTP